MNGDIETEAPRPRPLSGGLWTLFSWLRRDERSSSSDSLSSAGSDRTVASFAFLPPNHYQIAATPIVLPPPGPPTDSYKKRVRERNIRRQNDRDITLHRKYGLYREGSNSYDAFSLPAPRRTVLNSSDRQDRDRRATSESLQRRAAYVPGKRRAPAPPVHASSVGAASLTRRPTRKRPAPQPPTKLVERTIGNINNNINIQMNSKTVSNQNTLSCDISMGCKSEKYSKKDTNGKETKPKHEKNFLKQIFDNRKRNSAIEVSAIKILPSISELDKQAAEIIESSKLKAVERNNNITILKLNEDDQNFNTHSYWVCTTCSKRNEKSITFCVYCSTNHRNGFSACKIKNETIHTQTENKSDIMASTSRHCGNEDKQKLKEMLKEMKYSLPKRPKHESVNKKSGGTDTDEKREIAKQSTSFEENTLIIETPTLRIGSSLIKKDNSNVETSEQIISKDLKINTQNIDSDLKNQRKLNVTSCAKQQETVPTNSINSNNALTDKHDSTKQNISTPNTNCNKEKNINTPLRISSLFNPVYIPKTNTEMKQQLQKNISQENDLFNLLLENSPIVDNAKSNGSKAVNTRISSVLVNSVPQSTSASSNVKSILIEKNPNGNKITTTLLNSSEPSTSSNVELSGHLKSVITEESSLTEKKDNKPKEIPQNILKYSVPTNDSSEKNENLKDIRSTSKINFIKAENPTISNIEKVNQHTRRRDLVNQLEQSIAKGDEHAAAEAAIKLAQLRLSCSVLSFSSQIIGANLNTSDNKILDKIKVTSQTTDAKKPADQYSSTVNSATQTSVSTPSKNNVDRLTNAQKLTTKINENIISLRTDDKISSPVDLKLDNSNKNKPSTSKDIKNEKDVVTIAVWVEDKEAARGPVQLHISRHARLGYLRRQAETTLGIAGRLQRWIVGRTLCTDDNTLLMSLAGPDLNAPFYLCLVESEIETKTNTGTTTEDVATKNQNNDYKNNIGNVYTELVQLEQHALVPNAETFECEVCMEECLPGRGAVLRECVHSFCRDCLTDLIRHCEEPAVSCPAMECPGTLHEREIRALATAEEYERWLARGLAAAESGIRNAFHCRTRDCTGWAYCEADVRKFPCPVCKSNNCVPCQAIHEGETCERYRAKVQQAKSESGSSQTDEGTRALLDTLISRGEALKCPECSAIITKKWGCDWVKCSACKTEICWVTRGRRWGPGGKGDTSGGCRCGVDGKKCHPSCGYCH